MCLFLPRLFIMLSISPDVYLRYEVQRAVCRYFAQSVNLEPTEADYHNWLPGLPDPLYAICRAAGFPVAKRNLSFRRFVLEVRGFSLYEFLSEEISPEALSLWLTLKEYGSGLNPNDWHPDSAYH